MASWAESHKVVLSFDKVGPWTYIRHNSGSLDAPNVAVNENYIEFCLRLYEGWNG